MDILRELLRKELHKIWQEEYLPRFTKKATDENIRNAYDMLITKERNPWSRAGLCNIVLDKFSDYEENVKAALEELR